MKLATLEELRNWIDCVLQEADVIAPCDVDGHVLYRQIASGAAALFDFERPQLSAKQCVLPPSEVLLKVQKRGPDVVLEDVLLDRPQIVFNVRPCDAHGIAVMDALFLSQEPADRQYRHRREQTTLVGLACRQMWDGCFCTSVGGGPDDGSHVDLLLHEVDGGYTIDVITKKGARLLKRMRFEEGPTQLSSPGANAELLPVVSSTEWRALFEDRMWMRHGERCLSCRICAYVCPTCRCFDVIDRVVAERDGVTQIERVRVWDACTSPNYRRAAGGHNARPTKSERVRNRFYCKFCYYPEDFGPLGCVGCGRCVVSCPVDIDITEVMVDVAEAVRARSVQAEAA